MSIKKWFFDLLDRAVPAKHADEGLRALSGESPIHPESVQKGLESKFGGVLLINNRVGGNVSLTARQIVDRLHSEKRQRLL